MKIEILRFIPTLAILAVVHFTVLRKVGEEDEES